MATSSRQSPPQALIDRLDDWGLANPAQVRRMTGWVRRLARDLPPFESVWVDALAQARVLTPYQATRVNAGQGATLRVGPYLIRDVVRRAGFATTYRARHADQGNTDIRLTVAPLGDIVAEAAVGTLSDLAAMAERLSGENLAPITDCGLDGDRLWVRCRWITGKAARQWLIENGRVPPEAVLEIARQMVAGLVLLEREDTCHGDVCTEQLLLTGDGRAILTEPGLRPVLRGEEGLAHADLQPEAYDYLAPERIAQAAPADTAGDTYSCGGIWWHLLTGRPPIPGGDSLAKLRGAGTIEFPDLRELAPETPARLAKAVGACLQRDPRQRPASLSQLAETLGPPTRAGRTLLAKCIRRPHRIPARLPSAREAIPPSSTSAAWTAVLVAVALGIAAACWPWIDRQFSHIVSVPQDRSPTAVETEPELPPAEERSDVPPGDTRPVPADVLELPSEGTSPVRRLNLRPGQCVRGRSGQRPLLRVPPSGLVIDTDDVRLEDIDFRLESSDGPAPGALIDLRATGVEFRRCTFSTVSGDSGLPAAIRWTYPRQPQAAPRQLSDGTVRLTDCVFREVGSGVDCHTAGPLAVEVVNTLYLGRGPLIGLDHAPGFDESVVLRLSHCTLRGPGALAECRQGQRTDAPGEIEVRAIGCVFALPDTSALLVFTGAEHPQRLLDRFHWEGEGSLLAPGPAVARWHHSAGGVVTELDDASVDISGLVRGEVEFVGGPFEGPQSSRLTGQWQAPLHSTERPGIDPAKLPWPERPEPPGPSPR